LSSVSEAFRDSTGVCANAYRLEVKSNNLLTSVWRTRLWEAGCTVGKVLQKLDYE